MGTVGVGGFVWVVGIVGCEVDVEGCGVVGAVVVGFVGFAGLDVVAVEVSSLGDL